MTEIAPPPVEPAAPPAAPPAVPPAVPPVVPTPVEPPIDPPAPPPADFVADSTKTDEENAAALAAREKANGKKEEVADDKPATFPENWRELAAGDNEDRLKLAKRYGSPAGILKALEEAQKTLRSGKQKMPMPDPKDEKAMSEWRKSEGIPDDPTGYTLPETVIKRMTDEDKPMLTGFTEYMHGKGANQAEVARATEWYFDSIEQLEAQRIEGDKEAQSNAEEDLRKDWGAEYKGNLKLAARFVETIPGVGPSWSEARLPDGRLLGSVPEFISWASDQGRQTFGDAVFASPDSEARHASRKAEIETIMKTDMNRYYAEGLDKELQAILEKEEKRRK